MLYDIFQLYAMCVVSHRRRPLQFPIIHSEGAICVIKCFNEAFLDYFYGVWDSVLYGTSPTTLDTWRHAW